MKRRMQVLREKILYTGNQNASDHKRQTLLNFKGRVLVNALREAEDCRELDRVGQMVEVNLD